jgi:hypothetical protein
MVDDVLDAAVDLGFLVVRTWGFIDVGSVNGGSVASIDGEKVLKTSQSQIVLESQWSL